MCEVLSGLMKTKINFILEKLNVVGNRKSPLDSSVIVFSNDYSTDLLSRLELGYADRSGAWRAVRRGMLRKTSEDISTIRWQVCVDLTRMADAVEGYALSGNLKAAHDVIKLVDLKLKVAGL